MAKNMFIEDGYHLTVVCSDPTTPASGDPVRVGKLTGVAETTETGSSHDNTGNAIGATSVDFGPRVWKLNVDDNESGGIAVGAKLYYHDSGTGSPATSINNSSGSADAVFGVALETVSSNGTAVIQVLHLPIV